LSKYRSALQWGRAVLAALLPRLRRLMSSARYALASQKIFTQSWEFFGKGFPHPMSLQVKHFYEFGPFQLHPTQHVLLRDGKVMPITPKTFETLLALVERHGQVVGKDELMTLVWPDTFVEEVNLAKNISALRKVLGESDPAQQYIETIPKRGYRFVANIVELREEEESWAVNGQTKVRDVTHHESKDKIASGNGDQGARELAASTEIGQTAAAQNYQSKPKRGFLTWMFVLLTMVVAVAIWVYFSRDISNGPSLIKVIPFTSLPGREDQAAFSPDGNQLAFVWDGADGKNPDIYIKSIGGERLLRLTSDPAIDILPAWSPDGQRIAFLRIAENGYTVYVVPVLGNGPERKLLPLATHPGMIAWSPDGKSIAVSDKNAGQGNIGIHLYSLETGEKLPLTSPPASAWGDFCSNFSPDGRSLAFLRASNQLHADLYVVAVAGGEPQRLTFSNSRHFFDQGVVGGLAWTADSRELIYTSHVGGTVNLWKVSSSGGTPEQMAVGGVDAYYPAISRHGNRLAYTQIYGATPVYRIDRTDGTLSFNSPDKLIASTRSDRSPQFSPDGKSISFESDRSGSYEIWVCDSEGANPIQLTSFGGPDVGPPRWSPDGRQIVFSKAADLYVVSVESRISRRITTEVSNDSVPSWSRDGKWIYFSSDRSGDQQLWKVSVDGGHALQVTKGGGFTTFESADGRFVYYSKGTAASGIWKVPVEGGQETLVLDGPGAGVWGRWTVADDGIYFINTKAKGAYTIDFFNFSSRQVGSVAVLQDVNEFVSGLAISPDGRRILYSQQDKLSGDIMLVDHFR
jgi:Tol biopolymer transport system component/DNA-binding winged helix-turn-helix (wHTH) protein